MKWRWVGSGIGVRVSGNIIPTPGGAWSPHLQPMIMGLLGQWGNGRAQSGQIRTECCAIATQGDAVLCSGTPFLPL